MKEHNVYKNIVYLAFSCFMIVWLLQGIEFWKQQQKSFQCAVQSKTELTESMVKEMEKITGLYEFSPIAVCSVSLQLEEYSMETTLIGIDLDYYPLRWKTAEREIRRGNAPVLFFGEDAFEDFVDNNGNSPGKSQVSEWINQYQDLELTLTEENGQVQKGKICGILEQPRTGIYMDKNQMQECYGALAKTTGGCMKIQGKSNMQTAKELLEQAGFMVEQIE